MKELDKIVDSYRDDLIAKVQEVIRIKSTDAPKDGDMPFGEGIHRALLYMLDLSESMGLRSVNLDNYIGYADYLDEKEMVGVLGHLDVVPVGDDWTYPPFGGQIHDGKIYGRGTLDDKGPTMAALFAIKAIKESGLPLKKMVRIIFGTNEESSWKGIAYYKKRERMPDVAFTPDADFPIIHGEKGMIRLKVYRNFEPLEGDKKLISLVGGNVVNAVADTAQAVIEGGSSLIDSVKSYDGKGVTFEVKAQGNDLHILAHGKAAHASLPELGRNAISELMLLLSTLPIDENGASLARMFENHVKRDVHGESMGIYYKDDESGEITFNVGIIKYDGQRFVLNLDMRYPVTDKFDRIVGTITEKLAPYGLKIEVESHEIPIYTPLESPLVHELLEVYRDYTGDMVSKPAVIGGGTYAKAMKNAVAFGPLFPGQEELAHQRDEHIEIDRLILMTKMYASAIYRLGKKE